MSTNVKMALALTVPAIGLFIGAMMLRGPGSQLGAGQTSGPGKPRGAFIFVEWREDGRYYGRSYRASDIAELIEILRTRRNRGATIENVFVDGKPRGLSRPF